MKLANLVILVVFCVLAIVLVPLITIWALNTLFPVLAIPYSFETWVAVVIVRGVMQGLLQSNFSSKK